MPVTDLRPSWLDFKLGFRMLARYPGLTIVGGLAMAFAIWIGAVVAAIFRRPVIHVALGVLAGVGVIVGITLLASGGKVGPRIFLPFG